jgi:hypothetical protein
VISTSSYLRESVAHTMDRNKMSRISMPEPVALREPLKLYSGK